MLGLVFVSRSLLSLRMAVPLPTGRPESSHGAFGKGIQTTVSWQKDIQTSVWATRQAGEITAPVVCLDLSLELLNSGRAANTRGIEGKLLLLVAVYCLPALGPNLPNFQLPTDICTPALHVSSR